MRTFFLIILNLFLQQNLHSQHEVVGQLEFFKSNPFLDPVFESSTDEQIRKLNNREHLINIRQRGESQEITTDSSGFFRAAIFPTDTIYIEVNRHLKVLSGAFVLHPSIISDTLRLRISDKNLVLYKDSLGAPEFYKMYNEQQAIADFKNGRLRLLALGGEITKEEKRKQKKLSEKYKVTFEYPLFGSMHDRSKLRIMDRYNRKMKELIGIKYVW